jgi:manganese/iron transport system ATP-binding protein
MATLIGRPEAHQAGSPVLEVSSLTVRYNGRLALEDVSFRLDKGERVAVVGPNGAGKSTLFKVIAGVLQPAKGWAKVYGHGPGGHICIAYVPQRSQVDWAFPVSVTDVVMMGRIGRLGLLRWPSGGQQQRVFIARALAQEAELMLMDEPLTGLDVTSQEDIFRILDELRRRQVTVMVATHDLSQASERFDRLMLLNRRLLGLGQPDDVLTPERLAQAYGSAMRLIQTAEGMVALSDTCCEGEHEAA